MDPGPGMALPLSLSLFWPLLLLLAAAGGALAWRWQRSRGTGSPDLPLHLRARVELSPQHVLYVVEAADRCLLLGGAPGSLSLLTELPPRPQSTAAPAEKELAA